MTKPTAASVIAAIRVCGSDATDLRDAAHEAHHALSAGVVGKWDRERIHRAVVRLGRSGEVRDELMARAVEQLVCAHFRVKIDPVSRWAFVSAMEAIKFRRPFLSPSEAAGAIERLMDSVYGREAAQRVIELGSAP